ncbi:putative Diguanylate cyclase [Magnetospirillum sp. LM-5]|uniref:diguanylate cyclase domain-containing protein n=1 Tax=Magnetospirillum sp. LM-5 TaxID=2681466 RepID=UPI001384FCB2|nr:diguanylate cyclase [Magnetospirillum sp. LM-5]CAA7611827.1 putative Diguanylate cyclase [Magnetospirillum sp. LM-5]
MGAVSKVWAVSLGLPVSLGDKGVLCLRMNMTASSFNDVLGEQRLPEHWTGVLLAADGTTVARTRSPESAIGTKAPPSLVKAQAERRTGLFPTLTREGVPSSTALSKVPGWDLWVAIAVPEASIDAEADRFLIEVAVAGCAVLAASIVVALWLARHLAGQITRASAASAALADGHADSVPDSDIVELGAMGAALGTVKAREIETQAALLEAVSVNEQTAAALSQAQCDQLTGLAGRGLFLDQAQALKDNCPDGSGLAILFIDLDGFKAVNDTLGHEAGDRVLVRAADILRAAIGAGDVVGRLGGDEFVIGVAGPIDAIGELAADIAGRLVASIATIGDGIGCSIGVATPHPGPERLGDIMKRADQAMYAAKRHGKNCYVVAQR